MDNIICSVVREHHWTPEYIESLYLDDMDFFGLIYWYNDIRKMIKEINPEKKD